MDDDRRCNCGRPHTLTSCRVLQSRSAAVAAWADGWEHHLGLETVCGHLVLFSIFTAASLLDVRVSEVCEREAGNVGRRDGEPGAG